LSLLLPKKLVASIREHAQEGYPNEVCGFMIGTTKADDEERTVKRIRPAPNTFDGNKRTRFTIHPKELLMVEDELEGTPDKILGFYHSHPDYPAAPSLYDQEHAWPWYSYVVVSVLAKKMQHLTSWRLTEDRSDFLEETVVLR
jgi:proteasome lid subunit RPN8/RPN11